MFSPGARGTTSLTHFFCLCLLLTLNDLIAGPHLAAVSNEQKSCPTCAGALNFSFTWPRFKWAAQWLAQLPYGKNVWMVQLKIQMSFACQLHVIVHLISSIPALQDGNWKRKKSGEFRVNSTLNPGSFHTYAKRIISHFPCDANAKG